MKNMILSTLVVAVIAAAAVAQSTTPEPAPAQSTPAPSTSVQSTPAVTSAPQPAAPGQDAAGQAQNANQFPAGTVIPVELSKSVDSKKAKAGDKPLFGSGGDAFMFRDAGGVSAGDVSWSFSLELKRTEEK